MTPQYETPVIRNDKSCLIFTRGTWKIQYKKDGVKKQKSTKTKDFKEAVKARDQFFKDLGLKPKKRPGSLYIYRVAYYKVRIPGIFSSTYPTFRKAVTMRNGAMKEAGMEKKRETMYISKVTYWRVRIPGIFSSYHHKLRDATTARNAALREAEIKRRRIKRSPNRKKD